MLRMSVLRRLFLLTTVIVFAVALPAWPHPAAATATEEAEAPQAAAETEQKPAVIAVFSFNQALLESPIGDDPLFGSIGAESLKDLVARLEKAHDDDQVAGVLVLMGDASMGNGQLEELHTVLRQIRAAGKPVYAHADYLTFGRLALLSSASRISVSPTGHLFVTGMYGAQPHVRGLLGMLHVTPDYLTCGAYKSAAEMFTRSAPSPEAEEMYDWLYDSLYDSYMNMIAEGREVSTETVSGWIDLGICSAEKATEQKIIDATETIDQLLSHLRQEHGEKLKLDKKYGKSKAGTIDVSNPFAVLKIWADLLKGATPSQAGKKDAVAIVYVEGGDSSRKTDAKSIQFAGSDGL